MISRHSLTRSIDWALEDFTSTAGESTEAGATVARTDIATLTKMADAIARFVAEVTELGDRLDIAREGAPSQTSVSLGDLIAGEVVADHFRLSPAAARVLTAIVEAS
jgi:hypothetical protein